jgi:hypothetical protein
MSGRWTLSLIHSQLSGCRSTFVWATAVVRMKVQPQRFNKERERLLSVLRSSKRFEVAKGTGEGVRR